MTNDEEQCTGPGSDPPAPPQPGESYLVALGRRRASRHRRIFADQHFYAIPEVADKLKVKEELVRELIRRGELHAFRIGKAYRITDDDIDEYLQSCSTRQENMEEE
jgi:excisionase family DNA binding protein